MSQESDRWRKPGPKAKALEPDQLAQLTFADVLMDDLHRIVRGVLGREDAFDKGQYQLLGRYVTEGGPLNVAPLTLIAPELLGTILIRAAEAFHAAWNNPVKRLVLEVGLGNPVLNGFWGPEKPAAIADAYSKAIMSGVERFYQAGRSKKLRPGEDGRPAVTARHVLKARALLRKAYKKRMSQS